MSALAAYLLLCALSGAALWATAEWERGRLAKGC